MDSVSRQADNAKAVYTNDNRGNKWGRKTNLITAGRFADKNSCNPIVGDSMFSIRFNMMCPFVGGGMVELNIFVWNVGDYHGD